MAYTAYQNGGEPERFETDNNNGSNNNFDTGVPSLDFGGRHAANGSEGDRLFSRMETPADTAFARTKREEEIVLQCIQQAGAINSPTVDLSGKHLMSIPDELMQLAGIEFLYLEGNEISFLPDEFFKAFPRLKWLDLRNNRLTRVPSIYLGSHHSLRNVLLQNNLLKSLPLELGLVKTLHGLNITNNPLEFPPQEILQRGTFEIQKFLQEMLKAKSSATSTLVKEDLVLDCIFEDSGDSSSSDDWNTNASMMELARQRRLQKKSASAETASDTTISQSGGQGQVAPAPLSAESRRTTDHSALRRQTKERLRKASLTSASPGTANSSQKPPSSVMSWKVNQYPEPPTQEYLSYKMAEERESAKVKEMRQRTDAILQRRKDDASLKGWRDDAKKLQAQKRYQKLTKGTSDYPETAEDAPFAVDKPYMKMPNNEDRMKEAQEKPRRVLSPASRARIEEEKATKIRELEKRIKDHTSQMADRRRRPRGTPQEEMDASRRELEVVKTLQSHLKQRYQELKTWTTG